LHSPHKMGQRGRTFFNVQSEGICAKHTGSESTLLLQRAASGGSAVASDGDASGLSVHVPTPSLVSTGDDAFGALLVVAPWVSTAGVGLAVAAGGGVVSADVEAAGARVVVKIVAVVVVAVVVVVAKMVVVMSAIMVVALRQTRFWMEEKAFPGLSAVGSKDN